MTVAKDDPWALGGAIDKQNGEFKALVELRKAYDRLPAVVDDDYPEMRLDYDRALFALVAALKSNRPHLFTPAIPAPAGFDTATLLNLHAEIDAELGRAGKWPPMNSAHEGYGVLMEEVDELWEHVKTRQKNRVLAAMRAEAIQVAAMAVRFAHDICNEDRGRK